MVGHARRWELGRVCSVAAGGTATAGFAEGGKGDGIDGRVEAVKGEQLGRGDCGQGG